MTINAVRRESVLATGMHSRTDEMADPDPENDALRGRYANAFRIGYNAYEVILDFGQSYEGEKEHMHTRIVTSPPLAKDLSDLLHDSVLKQSQKYQPGDTGE